MCSIMLADHLRTRWLRELMTHDSSMTPAGPKRKLRRVDEVSACAVVYSLNCVEGHTYSTIICHAVHEPKCDR
jgi:hypothetical protein